jgi:hypothetical protein
MYLMLQMLQCQVAILACQKYYFSWINNAHNSLNYLKIPQHVFHPIIHVKCQQLSHVAAYRYICKGHNFYTLLG